MNFLINPTFHPLFQTFISLILCSGLLNLGNLINKHFFKDYNYSFFNLSISVIFLSQTIFIFFVFGFFKEIIILLSYTLIFLGIININFFEKIFKLSKSLIKTKKNIIQILILITLFCFFIISIGPPSMADALDYHFGVPLYLLNHLEFPNQDIWLHGSLFGNGELFNAIGLYLNSDNFFTFLQFLSLVLFLEFLMIKENDVSKSSFILLFIISSPVILFLISGPKPLLFPQLLTTASLYILIKDKKLNIVNVYLIGFLLLGAIQFKLSFILSGTILGLYLLAITFKKNKKALVFLILVTIFFILPKIIYNFNQVENFQLINIFTTLPNTFLENLSQFRDNNFIYPLNFFITNSFGGFTTIIGFQLLLLVLIRKITKKFLIVSSLTILTIILHFIFGQQTSRIYFEFLLWLSIIFCFLEKKYFNYKKLTYFLIPQFFLVFIIAFYFAILSLLSLMNLDLRDKFMKKNSFEYQAIKWSNKQIPSDNIIISELRSNAFLNYEYIPLENTLNLQKTKKYVEFLNEKKPRYLISYKKNFDGHFLKNCIGEVYKISNYFEKATRNPFNQGTKFKVYIYYFNYDKLNYCANLN